MPKPLLIIVNGLPGSGKTTLAKRLSTDLHLPAFSRDGIYETLYDALNCQTNGQPPLLAPATFTFLYYIVTSLLAARQSLIVEGFFGRPELRTTEFRQLQQTHDFEPLQILCNADGKVLLERFLARTQSIERHSGHSDQQWLEQNKERLLQGHLAPLAIGGQLIEIDNTTQNSLNYNVLFRQVQTALSSTHHEEEPQ